MSKAVSATAYYCCGVRMLDAEMPQPVCADHYARRFMEADGLQKFAPFRRFVKPNASNLARHKIIDELVGARLAVDPTRLVVLVGAGFDSRAYRIPRGRWVELDQPELIARKNRCVPIAECPGTLERIPIEFGVESLADKLAPYAGARDVTVIVEGVLSYLDDATARATLATLRAVFPGHTLLCDLMTKKFFHHYSRELHDQILALGASFREMVDAPWRLIESAGYRMVTSHSMLLRANALGLIQTPRILLQTVLRTLRTGYRVYEFEALSAIRAADTPEIMAPATPDPAGPFAPQSSNPSIGDRGPGRAPRD